MSDVRSLSDGALAGHLAERAGLLLMAVRDDALFARGSGERERIETSLGDAGDAVAAAFVTHALRAARPGDGMLCEEGRCDGSRFRSPRVWVIDPLDGTREYREGRDDWAVHVALVADGVAIAGAVAVPALGIVHRSDGPRALPPAAVPPRLLVSRTRPAPEAGALGARIGATLVPMGSAGAKVAAILDGCAEAYVHSGDLNDWDAAAPVAVAVAHGLHVSHLDGSAVRFNGAVPRLRDLLVCRVEVAGALLGRG